MGLGPGPVAVDVMAQIPEGGLSTSCSLLPRPPQMVLQCVLEAPGMG